MDNNKNNQLHMIADFEGDITELLKIETPGHILLSAPET